MNALTKPLGFCVALIVTFGLFTHILPQIKGEAPVEEEVVVGELTMDSFVAMGEKIYNGKGTCTLCHNSLGRAPDMLTYNVASVSLERLANSRYQGKATDAESYIRESMLEPSAYVVEGFGKKGSNDTESPMPAVDQPPIQLSEVAMGAVIAYLQQKDGNPVTVALPTAAPESDKAEETADAPPAPPKSPEEVIAKYGCAACHSIMSTQSVIGPNLNGVGERLKIDEIRTSIIDPKAVIADGFPPIMPNFPAMTVAELEMVAQFLVKQTEAQQ